MIKVTHSLFDFKFVICSSLKKDINLSKKQCKLNLDSVSSSFYRAKSKILDYAKNNIFNYMITITIDSKKIDINNVDSIKNKILKYFNNYKTRVDSNFKYIIVPELGEIKKRLHFHGLIYTEKEFDLTKHFSSHKNHKTNEILGNYYRNEWLFSNIGANTLKKIDEYNIKCANYITKYITKSEYNLSKIYHCSYFCSKGLKVSEVLLVDYENSVGGFKYGSNLDSELVRVVIPYLEKANLFTDYDFCSCCIIDFNTYSKVIDSSSY